MLAIRVGSVSEARCDSRSLAGCEEFIALSSVGRIWAGPRAGAARHITPELLLTNFHGSQVDNSFGSDGAFVSDVADARQQNLPADSSEADQLGRPGDEQIADGSSD